jgi:mannitol/fructose-specific phosphotransferase system IIA component (Ntr-type)
MRLRDLLSAKQVCTDLESAERDAALRELIELLVGAGKAQQEQVEPLVRALVRRETLGTTAIGRAMAVPHARAAGLKRTILAVGLSREGVQFNALDGEAVHGIFLVIGSDEKPDEYIEVMKKISDLIQKEDFRRFFLRARTAKEIVDLVDEME